MRPVWKGRPLEVCLFDLDGTLIAPSIDFGDMHRRVVEAVADHGLSSETFEGMHVIEIIERACEMLSRRNGGQADSLRAAAETVVDEIEMGAAERVQPLPGAADVLAWLSDGGCRLGIVTRNARRPVERILERIPLRHDVLLTRDDVPSVKPQSSGATEAALRTQAPDLILSDVSQLKSALER